MRGNSPRRGAVESTLDSYLREIDKTPLLTAEQERELAWRIGEGDVAARDQLVRANLRLVVSIARGYAGRGLDLADLVAEGNLGLMRAAEDFDPTMNTRFSTYAGYWIKQSIRRTLLNTAKMIRVPAYMVEQLAKWRRANAKLREELGRPPTEEELAAYLHLSKKKLRVIKGAIRTCQAEARSGQADAVCAVDQAPDPTSASQADSLCAGDDERRVFGLLDELGPREATVLRLRFGLGDEEPKTLKEVGEHLGLTRERVRQLEKQALRKLGRGLAST